MKIANPGPFHSSTGRFRPTASSVHLRVTELKLSLPVIHLLVSFFLFIHSIFGWITMNPEPIYGTLNVLNQF